MKKIIAYSLLFFANMVMLAHTIVPHHHHSKQICIKQEHCNHGEVFAENDSHCSAHEHSADQHKHEHDTKTPVNHTHDGQHAKECCVLSFDFYSNQSVLQRTTSSVIKISVNHLYGAYSLHDKTEVIHLLSEKNIRQNYSVYSNPVCTGYYTVFPHRGPPAI